MTLRDRHPVPLLLAILALAFALRFSNLGFGMPAMLDPDEPLFVLKGYELIDKATLNPGWFGHPGTTTIMVVALVAILVAGSGLLLGRFADIDAFAAAVYADPSILWVPARLAFVLIGVGVVALTYAFGRRLFERPVALAGAALLAVNALHVAWSQVIRTDIHSSFFMLAAMVFALRHADEGRMRDLLLAGLFAGFATATKWPAATVLAAGFGAWLFRPSAERRPLLLLLFAGSSFLGLFLASPYIFLAFGEVLQDVGGEVQRAHLSQASRGLLGNLLFYTSEYISAAGWPAFLLVLIGIPFSLADRRARYLFWPVLVLFGGLILTQPQIWSRWLTPLLPLLSLLAAVGGVGLQRWLSRRLGLAGMPQTVLLSALFLLAFVPGFLATRSMLTERANDTRTQASAWAQANLPAGSTILVEHFAFDLRGPKGFRVLFPLGQAGCVEGEKLISGGANYGSIQKSRAGAPIADLGHVSMDRRQSCIADFAILTYFDAYQREADSFPRQVETYRAVLAGGQTVALFRPGKGEASGPVARIVLLRQHEAGKSVP